MGRRGNPISPSPSSQPSLAEGTHAATATSVKLPASLVVGIRVREHTLHSSDRNRREFGNPGGLLGRGVLPHTFPSRGPGFASLLCTPSGAITVAKAKGKAEGQVLGPS